MVISSSNREVEYTIILVDDTRLHIRSALQASVRQICRQIAQKLNMIDAEHFSLFKPNGIPIPDHVLPLSRVPIGEKAIFIFKRLLFFQDAVETEDDQEMHLLFIQAYDDVIRGRYRLTPDEITQLAALYLQARLGPQSRQLYDPGFVEAWLSDLVPSYAERERSVQDWAEDIRRAHVVRAREDRAYVERRYVGALSKLEYYGYEMYDVEEIVPQSELEDNVSRRDGAASEPSTRPAVLGVGHRGLLLLTPGTLSVVHDLPYREIASWAPSHTRLRVTVTDGARLRHFEFHTTLAEPIVRLIEAYLLARQRRGEVDDVITAVASDGHGSGSRVAAWSRPQHRPPHTRFGFEYLDDPYTFPGLAAPEPVERLHRPRQGTEYVHHPSEFERDLYAARDTALKTSSDIRATLSEIRRDLDDTHRIFKRGEEFAHETRRGRLVIRTEAFAFDERVSRPDDFDRYMRRHHVELEMRDQERATAAREQELSAYRHRPGDDRFRRYHGGAPRDHHHHHHHNHDASPSPRARARRHASVGWDVDYPATEDPLQRRWSVSGDRGRDPGLRQQQSYDNTVPHEALYDYDGYTNGSRRLPYTAQNNYKVRSRISGVEKNGKGRLELEGWTSEYTPRRSSMAGAAERTDHYMHAPGGSGVPIEVYQEPQLVTRRSSSLGFDLGGSERRLSDIASASSVHPIPRRSSLLPQERRGSVVYPARPTTIAGSNVMKVDTIGTRPFDEQDVVAGSPWKKYTPGDIVSQIPQVGSADESTAPAPISDQVATRQRVVSEGSTSSPASRPARGSGGHGTGHTSTSAIPTSHDSKTGGYGRLVGYSEPIRAYPIQSLHPGRSTLDMSPIPAGATTLMFSPIVTGPPPLDDMAAHGRNAENPNCAIIGERDITMESIE